MIARFLKYLSLGFAAALVPAVLWVILTGRSSWLLSMGLGSLWILANHFFLWRLSLAVAKPGTAPGSVAGPMVLKFPVLYAAGAAIFFVPGFKIEGIFTVFTVYILAAALLFVFRAMNQKEK